MALRTLFLILLCPVGAPALGMEIRLSYPELEALLVQEVFSDGGRRYLRGDRSSPCSYAYLENPRLAAVEGWLRIDVELFGREGKRAFGRCLGAGDHFQVNVSGVPVYDDGFLILSRVHYDSPNWFYDRLIGTFFEERLPQEFRIPVRERIRETLGLGADAPVPEPSSVEIELEETSVLAILYFGDGGAGAGTGESRGEVQVAAPIPSALAPYVVVLGIAQDGGYPQAGTKESPAWQDPTLRRQVTCLALVDPESSQRWLFEATPDFGAQLYRLDQIAPGEARPGLDGILLTHAHVGHYAGLIHLGREVMGAVGVPVYAMPRMERFLRQNAPWSQLVALSNIELRPLAADVPVALNERLSVTPILVPHRDELSETVAFRIDGPQHSVLFLPDIDKWERLDTEAGPEGGIERLLEGVDVAYVDGTFFAGGEIPGRDMAEIPHPFIVESMRRLSPLSTAERSKIRFIHLNRTNPAIVQGSEAELQIEEAGFRVARELERVHL